MSMTSRGKAGQHHTASYNAETRYNSTRNQQQFTATTGYDSKSTRQQLTATEASFNAETESDSRGRQQQFAAEQLPADYSDDEDPQHGQQQLPADYSDDEEPQHGQHIPEQRILLFSRGVFEGSRICNALFGHTAFHSSSGEPETERSTIGQSSVEITNLPLKVGQQDERDIVNKAKRYMGESSYTAIVVVLKLPERATSETEAYYRIIRKIVGRTLFQNTILIVTNAPSFNGDKRLFQKYLLDEISSSKNRGFPSDALGTFIKAVHGDKDQHWERFNYDHCVLFNEKVQSTHHDLLNKAAELNQPFSLADTGIGSSMKSNIMLVIIIILAGIVIKLCYENYTRAVTECEKKLLKSSNEYDDMTLQLGSLQKETNKLKDNNVNLEIDIKDLKASLKAEQEDHENTKDNHKKELVKKDDELKSCESDLEVKKEAIDKARKALDRITI